VFKGYPYDQVVYMLRADALEKGALAEALAFRLSGNRAFAVKAADVLKAYADKYLTYPMHDNKGKESQFGARVYSQTLDESIWLIDMARAYDLIRDSDVLTAADRIHIERDLLYASAMTVSRANMGPTPNIQNWILGAEMAVGYTLNDQTLVSKALDGTHGLRAQLKKYVKDGFWTEGSWGYQFYALRPILFMAQMSTMAGVNLWKEEPDIKALLASPIGVMFPNGMLPAFNDSEALALVNEAPLYEVAYAATGDPLFAAIAAEGKRDSRFAYLFGAPSLGNAQMPALHSAVFPDAGYATLRSSNGGITQIVKFGPFGGPHGHFDKLNELIYAEGMVMGVDTGTHFYGIPIHNEWDKRTVAHNTISVDEFDQHPAGGKLLNWQSEPAFTAVSVDAGPVYADVDLKRTELVTDNYILEITQCHSTDGTAHDFDWNYHNYGTQAANGNFEPYAGFPQRDGYEMLTDNKTASVAGDFHTTFTMSKGRTLRVWVMKGNEPSQVFTGVGPGPDLRVPIPYVIVRRHGPDAEFVTLFEPSASDSYKVQSITRKGNRITIRGAGFEDIVEAGEKIDYRHTVLP
ncbi:MAG: heparinase II/III domain-containing protein, partial [Candidatus Binataceae bacterium]